MRPSLTSLVLLLSSLSSIASASPSPSGSASSTKHKVNAAENNPDDPTGKVLYITEPACGFYRCTVTWNIGESVAVNWLGPPGGDVAVSLMSNIGGPTYVITNSIAGTSQEGYCDSGYGLGVVAPGHECGRVEFVVPDGWEKMNNYTIVVQSLNNPDEIGYTDMITIAAANASNSVSDAPPSGTSVSLLTIAAPTTTNLGASTKPTISVPSPTAVTGQSSSSSLSAADSSARASSGNASSRGGVSSSVGSSFSAASAGSSPSATSSSQTPSNAAASSNIVFTKTGSALFAAAGAFVAIYFAANSRVHTENGSDVHALSSTIYGSAAAGIKRFEMNEEEMDPRMAARFVRDELLMDGNPSTNLASFVTTYMEPEAEQLMMDNMSKNLIDHEEYPAVAELESRCVNQIARLFNAPLDDENAEALGVSTVGSSEAIMLAVLAAKRRWKLARKAAGKDFSSPNIVMSAAVHCVFEKAANCDRFSEGIDGSTFGVQSCCNCYYGLRTNFSPRVAESQRPTLWVGRFGNRLNIFTSSFSQLAC
ncbi:uncharacterized protein JCM6883_002681 [Sporobolomyces salmoneus]|uniref:uncharacterized protein n=1 Tax=Sporobolomyces salmoneus TaxID=183962 RepID=UPI00316C83C4